IDGKYGKVTQRFKGTFAEAKAERGRMFGEVADGSLKRTEAVTMAELHDRYMKAKPTLSGASKHQYEYLWSKLDPHIGRKPVKKLTARDLDAAYAAIAADVSANTTI